MLTVNALTSADSVIKQSLLLQMALSVFAVTSSPARIVLCVVFGIPAIICWILPVFIYKATYKKREAVVAPIIEKKYDEIYEICSKGYKILHE